MISMDWMHVTWRNRVILLNCVLWFGCIAISANHLKLTSASGVNLHLLAQDLNGKNKQAHKENLRMIGLDAKGNVLPDDLLVKVRFLCR